MANLFHTVKGEITICMATTQDSDSIIKLRMEALMMHPEAFAADVDKTVADGEQAWKRLITDYDTNHTGVVCVALAGTELIGMAGITRSHWPKTRHFGTVWGVYIKSDWRGYHIGEEILNSCIVWAKANDMTVVNLGVNTINTSAIRCYTRGGFSIYGTESKVVYYNGIYYDEYLIVRLL